MAYLESEPNSVQRKFQQDHIERRLRIAKHARPDRPINLRFKNGIDPESAFSKRIAIKSVDKDITELTSRIVILESQVEKLIHTSVYKEKKETQPRSDRLNKTPPLFWDKIIDAVAAEYKVTRFNILGPSREDRYVVPRHVAIYLCRSLTNKSTGEIGRKFSRDHTVSIYAARKIERLLPLEAGLCQTVYELSQALEQKITDWRNQA